MVSQLFTIAIDPALTPVLESPFSSPVGAAYAVIQIDASGQYLFYGVSSGGANLMVYQMNLKTGVLTALPGYPQSVTVFGSNLLAEHRFSHFSFNPETVL